MLSRKLAKFTSSIRLHRFLKNRFSISKHPESMKIEQRSNSALISFLEQINQPDYLPDANHLADFLHRKNNWKIHELKQVETRTTFYELFPKLIQYVQADMHNFSLEMLNELLQFFRAVYTQKLFVRDTEHMFLALNSQIERHLDELILILERESQSKEKNRKDPFGSAAVLNSVSFDLLLGILYSQTIIKLDKSRILNLLNRKIANISSNRQALQLSNTYTWFFSVKTVVTLLTSSLEQFQFSQRSELVSLGRFALKVLESRLKDVEVRFYGEVVYGAAVLGGHERLIRRVMEQISGDLENLMDMDLVNLLRGLGRSRVYSNEHAKSQICSVLAKRKFENSKIMIIIFESLEIAEIETFFGTQFIEFLESIYHDAKSKASKTKVRNFSMNFLRRVLSMTRKFLESPGLLAKNKQINRIRKVYTKITKQSLKQVQEISEESLRLILEVVTSNQVPFDQIYRVPLHLIKSNLQSFKSHFAVEFYFIVSLVAGKVQIEILEDQFSDILESIQNCAFNELDSSKSFVNFLEMTGQPRGELADLCKSFALEHCLPLFSTSDDLHLQIRLCWALYSNGLVDKSIRPRLMEWFVQRLSDSETRPNPQTLSQNTFLTDLNLYIGGRSESTKTQTFCELFRDVVDSLEAENEHLQTEITADFLDFQVLNLWKTDLDLLFVPKMSEKTLRMINLFDFQALSSDISKL